MSGCFGPALTPDQKAELKKSRDIEKVLREDTRVQKEEVKLLLLGPGESGKSTFFKQIKLIQVNGGFSTEEKLAFRSVIVGNCISQMKVLISAARKLGYNISPANESQVSRVMALPANSDGWNPKNDLADIKVLWADLAIKETYKFRDVEFQLNDSAQYFFDNIDKYMIDEFCPDEQDVLRARVRTTGIDEAIFNFDDLQFRMVDVGGQRTERRKWIHCFDSVTAVIFCTALSEYDQKLREDSSKNRMHESLDLFQEICNGTYFKDKAIMLFLNKTDLFREKIQGKDLKICFPEYSGGCNYDNASKFIQERFLSLNQIRSDVRGVFVHFTCAVDTENVIFVFNAVRQTILEHVMQEIGLSMG